MPQHRLAALLAGRVPILVLLALITLLIAALAPRSYQDIDERLSDALWRLTPEAAQERRIIIVDIDEASLSRHGPWPWPRERLATLIERLHQAGANLLLIDILLPQPQAGDAHLRQALDTLPTVLAQAFDLQGRTAPPLAEGQLSGALRHPRCPPTFPTAQGYLGLSPALADHPAGHITPHIDPDGAVRRLPALICHGQQTYPALTLAALIAASHAPPELELTPGHTLLDPAYWLEGPGLQGFRLPLDERGNLRIAYRKPREAFLAISAADLLDQRTPAHLLQGAWVLLGGTAFGLGDAVPTPYGGAVGGVEVHAQLLSALLDGHLPYTPQGAGILQTSLALIGALTLLALTRLRGTISVFILPLAGLTLALGILLIHTAALLSHNLWIGPSAPASYLILSGLALGIHQHARTRRERERLYANLASYLPQDVAAELAQHAPSNVIEAHRANITALVADIRNYSAYCEGRTPEEAAALLHAFFTLAVRIIEQHGGVVENFIGDAILALWPAPQTPERQAERA
ncbi:MAG: CHASE2 domain-containing protein, partial [Halothiobacillaceae bacterium]